MNILFYIFSDLDISCPISNFLLNLFLWQMSHSRTYLFMFLIIVSQNVTFLILRSVFLVSKCPVILSLWHSYRIFCLSLSVSMISFLLYFHFSSSFVIWTMFNREWYSCFFVFFKNSLFRNIFLSSNITWFFRRIRTFVLILSFLFRYLIR